jgi:hypothetical protein
MPMWPRPSNCVPVWPAIPSLLGVPTLIANSKLVHRFLRRGRGMRSHRADGQA